MLVEAKKFSDISFKAISIGCWSDLLFDDDAEPVNSALVSLEKKDETL